MKQYITYRLFWLSLIWVPGAYSMSGDMEVKRQQLIQSFKRDPALPIHVIAGFLQPKQEIETTVELIREYVGPETPIYVHGLPDRGLPALKNVATKMAKIINDTPTTKETNIIGYSLGGLVTMSLVKLGLLKYQARFVGSIAGPLNGTKDIPYEGDDKFDATCATINEYIAKKMSCCSCSCRPFEAIETSIHNVAYTKFFQKTLSVANMWHDPRQEEEYLEKNLFLPYVNNQKDHKNSPFVSHNFTKGNSVVVALAAEQDKTLETGQTGIWDFVGQDGKTYQKFEETEAFERSGSRYLTDSHRLIRETIPDQGHGSIRVDEPTFIKYIIPNLTRKSQAEQNPDPHFYTKVNL